MKEARPKAALFNIRNVIFDNSLYHWQNNRILRQRKPPYNKLAYLIDAESWNEALLRMSKTQTLFRGYRGAKWPQPY